MRLQASSCPVAIRLCRLGSGTGSTPAELASNPPAMNFFSRHRARKRPVHRGLLLWERSQAIDRRTALHAFVVCIADVRDAREVTAAPRTALRTKHRRALLP
jgi:hypothetical protein